MTTESSSPGPHSREAAETSWFDLASHEQSIGISVDLRLFFRRSENGHIRASPVFLEHGTGIRLKPEDHGRAMTALVELKDADAVAEFFRTIAERGFAAIEPDEPSVS